jgi:hypothetical protein
MVGIGLMVILIVDIEGLDEFVHPFGEVVTE